ncbi:substrate-binding domain-containing protein [Victivallis vadensis]|uniref:Substrate-binding domain-containing protein n=1 Tax=Victivallis vadensis TaxID=172901 RepID=A0A848ASG5_9BACT|nr:substrate-binding domain-containing protein [Victivallis vadensis]NMD85941.1 substrate-binding domain-containing protein [Victivallis vadensis]
MRQDVQIEKLYGILRREIMRLPEGGKFHSVREMIRRYGVHRAIVDAALDRLEAEKLIYRRSRLGIFSNVPAAAAELRLRLFHLEWPSSTIMEWVESITGYVETHSRWKLTVGRIQARGSFDRLDISGCDALIMILNNQLLQERRNIDWLNRIVCPAVILDAEIGALPFNTVRSCDWFGMMEACRFLYDRGHRTVAYIRTEPAFPGLLQLADCFRKAAEMLGMKVVMIDSEVFYGEFSREKCTSYIQGYLDAHGGRCPFSAAFCESYDPAVGIAETLERNGIRIPEEVSIMTRGTLRSASASVPLTLVAADFERATAEVFEGLARLYRKEISCFKKFLPMRIIDRGSVADIGSALSG